MRNTSTTPGTYNFGYVFNYTHHLGNVRLSYAKNPKTNALEVLEENNYYPFGLKHQGYNADNLQPDYKYKYQGQERQDDIGLGWDSFKWRNYDYAIGRFMSIDPLTEEYNIWSPYVFSGNRVIDARELEGLEPYFPYKSKDAAAENFSQNYNGISIVKDREFATKVYSSVNTNGNTIYSYAEPVEGSPAGVNPSKVAVPEGTSEEAMAHTHGAYGLLYDNDNFSGLAGDAESRGDMGLAERKNLDVYVATPNGSFQKYDVKTNKVTLLSTSMPSDPKHPFRLNTKDAIVPVSTIKPVQFEVKPIEIKAPQLNLTKYQH